MIHFLKFPSSSSVLLENISFKQIMRKYIVASTKNTFFISRAKRIRVLYIPISHPVLTPINLPSSKLLSFVFLLALTDSLPSLAPIFKLSTFCPAFTTHIFKCQSAYKFHIQKNTLEIEMMRRIIYFIGMYFSFI
jgi:hypothetical protein